MKIRNLKKRFLNTSPLATAVLFSACIGSAFAEDTSLLKLDDLQVVADKAAPATTGLQADLAELRLTPGGVTLIEIDDLTERNVSSLADMLRYVPGVWAASDTGSDNIFFSSRGSNLDATDYDMNGIKLLQDGLSVTAADGNNHNRIIDPLSARYATVARGANGIKYGASTLGGAINFTTPTAYDSAPLTFSMTGGSHGQLLTRATASKVFNDQFDGLITIEDKRWNGYRDHNELDRQGIYANAGWKISDSVATRFYLTHLEDDEELAGALTKAEVKADRDHASAKALNGNYQKNVDTLRVANKTVWNIDDNRRLEVGLSFEEQDLYHPIVAASPPFFGGILIDNTQRDFGSSLRYSEQINNHDLLFGVNYGENRVDGEQYNNDSGNRDGLRRRVNNDASTLEAFVMDRWQLNDKWNLVMAAQGVSARRDVFVTNPDGSVDSDLADHYHSINPRLGAIFAVNQDVSLFANVSRLYEPPTNYQLQDKGNSDTSTLEAMQGSVFEIGTRGNQSLGKTNSWSWDLTLYYAKLKDEILSIDDASNSSTGFATNIDNTTHAGIEAVVSSEFALDDSGKHMIEPVLSLSINHFEFDNDDTYGDNDLPAAPEYVLKGEVLYRHANGFYAGPTFDVVGDRYADFANSYTVDSYTVFGLRTGWSNDKVKVFAEVRNIFDKDYIATHSVRDTAAADADILNPGEPLSAYVGFQIKM
ncbi:TonB-dependent receptor [Methylophaga sp. 42_25_T18]|nr:TonB-dependent receptor [Methylophaga sp. 42_25_T18]